MKLIVIGLGSMGKRRIRLLKKYNSDIDIIGVDSNNNRCMEAEKKYGIDTFQSIEDACKNKSIFCAFISTSPLSHANIINECLNNDMHIFSELNLVNRLYKNNIALAKEKNKILFLSSTFLYRKEIEYLKRYISESSGKVNYIYHVGQYLPDWHPWESYKEFFVSKKESNGCRELMAIEFPWLFSVFGDVEDFYVVSGKISKLELDFNDNYMITFKHKNGNKGIIALDVVSRKASRTLEIFNENIYMSWDGTPYGLKKYDYINKKEIVVNLYDSVDKDPNYCASVIEDAYLSEIENFFDVIKGEDTPRYSFKKDYNILNLIGEIEKL